MSSNDSSVTWHTSTKTIANMLCKHCTCSSLSNIRLVSHYGNTSGGSTYDTTSANYGRPLAAAIRESRLPVYKPQLPVVSSFCPHCMKLLAKTRERRLCVAVARKSDPCLSAQPREEPMKCSQAASSWGEIMERASLLTPLFEDPLAG